MSQGKWGPSPRIKDAKPMGYDKTYNAITTMKLLLVLAAIVAISVAAPQNVANSREATIVDQTNDNIGIGPWSWSFKTSDGTVREESGTIENQGTDDEAIVMKGTITYVNAEGKTISYSFIADKNGFQPQGDFLPK